MRMNKIARIVFDVICIILILLCPYFILEKTGIVDCVKENRNE